MRVLRASIIWVVIQSDVAAKDMADSVLLNLYKTLRRGVWLGSWWGNRWERDNWGDLGVDGWIILGWISRKWDVVIWTGLGWPRIETEAYNVRKLTCSWVHLHSTSWMCEVAFVLRINAVYLRDCKDQDIYRTIILPVVLYGCETWSLTLREERKLRVFENMVLRRIFGPRRDEVTGE